MTIRILGYENYLISKYKNKSNLYNYSIIDEKESNVDECFKLIIKEQRKLKLQKLKNIN